MRRRCLALNLPTQSGGMLLGMTESVGQGRPEEGLEGSPDGSWAIRLVGQASYAANLTATDTPTFAHRPTR